MNFAFCIRRGSHVFRIPNSQFDPLIESGSWARVSRWEWGVYADSPAATSAIVSASSTRSFRSNSFAIVSAFQTDLATVNHISIYTTTYGSDGAHLVHRNGSGHDGAVVTEPLSPTSHVRLLSFSDQSF